MQTMKLLRKYANKWVALNSKRTQVLAFGQSIDEVLSQLKDLSAEEPILTYVSPLELDYVG